MVMITEQEVNVRAAAAQAAASVAATLGMGEPHSVIKVAVMMENYINQGADAAHKIIDSWGASPPESAPAPPGVTRAQELADLASAEQDRQEVLNFQGMMRGEKLEDEIVNIGGVGGTLDGYLKHRLKDFPEERNEALRNELGL